MCTMSRTVLSVLIVFAASNSAADYEVTVLNEFDSRRALVSTFSSALPYARVRQCTEYSLVEGEGFNRKMTILTSCRITMEPHYFNRLLGELSLNPDTLNRNAPYVCPTDDEFSASEVYVSYGTVDAWDINITAMYMNSARTEYLVCHKVMIVH